MSNTLEEILLMVRDQLEIANPNSLNKLLETISKLRPVTHRI